MNQVSLDQVYRFDQTPSARVKRLRKEARGTPPGVRRDELLRRVQQIENISPAQEPLASLDLQPPKWAVLGPYLEGPKWKPLSRI